MVKIFESTQIIRRIIHLAQDEPMITTETKLKASTQRAEKDEFEAGSAAKANSSITAWFNVIWAVRNEKFFDDAFIDKFILATQETIESISELPEQYYIKDRLLNSSNKKQSILSLLQNMIDSLRLLKNKSIGSLTKAVLWRTADIENLLKQLSDPIIKLIVEFSPENKLDEINKQRFQQEAVSALVAVIKAVPFAIPSYKEINKFATSDLYSHYNSVESSKFLYCKNLEMPLKKLRDSLNKLGASENITNKIVNIIKFPEQANDILIPEALSSLGKKIDEPFNQVLGGYMLQLAAKLAPLCAPNKEKPLTALSNFSHAALEKIASFMPSLKRFLNELKSDFKQQKISNDLRDIDKFVPHIYGSLQKTPLGQKNSTTALYALETNLKSQESQLANKYEMWTNQAKVSNKLSRLLLWALTFIFKYENPIFILDENIFQLKNNKIDLITFFNALNKISSKNLWINNLVKEISHDLKVKNGLLDIQAEKILELGNKTILALVEENLQKFLTKYNTLCQSFNDEFWKTISHKAKTKNIQAWLSPFLQFCLLEIENININSFKSNPDLKNQILLIEKGQKNLEAKHNLLNIIKVKIESMSPENQNNISAEIANLLNINYESLPRKIRLATKKLNLH